MTPENVSKHTREICSIVPVLIVDETSLALRLAEVLISGGLPVLEVALRRPNTLDVIHAMSKAKGGVVGAGALITPEDVYAAKAAGAAFGVSPGMTESLITAPELADLILRPGTATASEAMALLARGYDMLKFFPAEVAGGVTALMAIGAPLPQLSFCPTGGMNPENVHTYLALENVVCVGGSWTAPPNLIKSANWQEIETRAEKASQLRML